MNCHFSKVERKHKGYDLWQVREIHESHSSLKIGEVQDIVANERFAPTILMYASPCIEL